MEEKIRKGKMPNTIENVVMQNVGYGGGASRLLGRAALREAIERLRQKADEYEALLNELPDELSQKADEGLWLLAINIQR